MELRGQGASEYLVLLGAVLLVALTVVVLLSYFTGFTGELTETESRTYWAGYAKPFAIYDAVHNPSGGMCGGGGQQVELVIKNADKYPLNLTAIYLNSDTNLTICSPPNTATSPPFRFAPNEEKVVAVRVASTFCEGKTRNTVWVVLRYDSPYIPNRAQNGTIELYVNCA
ncbi:TPA: hypothetical protein HA243_05570 [Candidatus Micrarchaeota archaeon]|nr:hypothetical protein [Candidatus Micrarchaeota archaeon]